MTLHPPNAFPGELFECERVTKVTKSKPGRCTFEFKQEATHRIGSAVIEHQLTSHPYCPTPESERTYVAAGLFPVTVSVAVEVPATVGANTTTMAQFDPGATMAPQFWRN